MLTYWLKNKYKTSIDNQEYPKFILWRLPRPVCRWNGIWQPEKMQLLQKKVSAFLQLGWHSPTAMGVNHGEHHISWAS